MNAAAANRILYVAACAVIVWAFAGSARGYALKEAASASRAGRDVERIAAAERVLAQTARYRTVRARVERDLRPYRPALATRNSAARLLNTLAGLSPGKGARIAAVQPGTALPRAGAMAPLQARAVEIDVTGTFPQIVDFVERAPRRGSLLEIQGVDVALASSRLSSESHPLLAGRVRAQFYTLPPASAPIR